MNAGVYALPGVDYAEKGARLEVAVEGRVRPQMVIYSGLDFQGEKWYYTEEGHRYILDSRRSRSSQWFVENYLDKIPIIVRNPLIVGRDTVRPDSYLYFGQIAVKERGFKKELFVVVIKKGRINVAWNFFWVDSGRVPKNIELLYRTKRAGRYLKGRR